jgi:putative methyltransferase (TIGR04325 family)
VPPIFIWGYDKLVNKNVQPAEKDFAENVQPAEKDFAENARRAGKVFIGKYENFDDLRAQLKSETNYYWPGAIEQEFNAQERRIIEWSSLRPPSGNFRTNFLSAALTLFSEEKIRVLDIGGGLNNVFEYLKFSLKKKCIHVTVFDQLPAVQNGKKLYGHMEDIEFVDSLPEGRDCFDVIYFGSSFQYFPDYRELFAKIANLNPRLIVIADSSFGVSSTFACAQVNMPGTIIPYMMINKTEFESVACNLGYELIHQSINDNDYFGSYEYPQNLSRSWNFIFSKIKQLEDAKQ